MADTNMHRKLSQQNKSHRHQNYHIILYTRVYADNFWLNFKDKASGVGLYAGDATQPYINSQSAWHGPLVGHEAFMQA